MFLFKLFSFLDLILTKDLSITKMSDERGGEMRLGNFWGMTVPMSLLIFDGRYEELLSYLSALNTSMSKHLLIDIQKEIVALLSVIGCASYKLPKYEKVIDSLLEMDVVVQDGTIEGDEDGVLFQSVVSEVAYRVLELVLKRAGNGEFYQVPAKLRDYVEDFCRRGEFDGLSASGLPGKILKSFSSGKSLYLGENVKTFQLIKSPPKVIYFGGKKTIVTEILEKVWQFYADRESVLRDMLRCCTTGYQNEEEVFGVPFFSMIKRKPESLRYKVLEIFERASVIAEKRILVDCIRECSEEILKFERLVKEFVIEEGITENTEMMSDSKLAYLSHSLFQSEKESDIFIGYLVEGKLTLSDLKEEDFRLLIALRRRLKEFEKCNLVECFGVEGIRDEELIEECCNIGICGLNKYSIKLFEEALAGVTLSGHGKIQKTREELEKIDQIIADVKALVCTLVPVGGEVLYVE